MFTTEEQRAITLLRDAGHAVVVVPASEIVGLSASVIERRASALALDFVCELEDLRLACSMCGEGEVEATP